MCPTPCLVLHLPYLTKPSQCNLSKCFHSPYVVTASQVTPQNLNLILHKAPRMPHSVLAPGFLISRYPPTSLFQSHRLSSAKSRVAAPCSYRRLTLLLFLKTGSPKDPLPLLSSQVGLALLPQSSCPWAERTGGGSASLSYCSLPLPYLSPSLLLGTPSSEPAFIRLHHPLFHIIGACNNGALPAISPWF